MTFTQPAHLQSFGRRRGRRLRKSRSALMETLLPKLLITLPSDNPVIPAQAGISLTADAVVREIPAFAGMTIEGMEARGSRRLWFEIGFGGGEHLVEQARRHSGINFIGCEPYINGMAKLLAAIDKDKLANVRLFDGDARTLLALLPDASIERLFVLFPDPWPKARHHKRRIISQESLALFYLKLAPGGLLRLATDHEEYGAWMLEQLMAFGKFRWTAKGCADWQNPPADWVPTRYQAKAEAEGRKPLFLEWVKLISPLPAQGERTVCL